MTALMRGTPWEKEMLLKDTSLRSFEGGDTSAQLLHYQPIELRCNWLYFRLWATPVPVAYEADQGLPESFRSDFLIMLKSVYRWLYWWSWLSFNARLP